MNYSCSKLYVDNNYLWKRSATGLFRLKKRTQSGAFQRVEKVKL